MSEQPMELLLVKNELLSKALFREFSESMGSFCVWLVGWGSGGHVGGGEVKGREGEEGAAREEEGGEDSACTCNFPHLLHPSLGSRGRGGGGVVVCRQAGRGTWWKHLRRGLGETWAPISLPSPTHQLRVHPAHFLVWPWSLASRSFFIHINVEVSSHTAGVSVLQVTAL